MTSNQGAGQRSILTVGFAPFGHSGDYAVDTSKVRIRAGEMVVVEGFKGLALGRALGVPRDAAQTGRIRRVIRPASSDDIDRHRAAVAREPEVLRLALRFVRTQELPWKLVRVVADGIGNQVTLCFAASERQDTRAAAKELSRLLGVRIVMRQVGLRDVTRVVGGLGRCGREFCCSSWLREYPHATIRMAKDQNLALSPEKTSGVCGKSLCCLAYEHDFYKERRGFLPKLAKRARTTEGLEGKVVGLDVLRQTFTLLDEQGRRHVLSAEAWTGNEGQTVPRPAVGGRPPSED